MYKIPSMKSLLEQTENKNHKFSVISLFAGGGGSSCGYRMAGGKVLAINEFVPEAAKTYQENWPSTLIYRQDIRNLSGEEILAPLGIKKGDLDILDGSPPCSAFSTAGIGKKGWGKKKAYSDTTQSCVEDLFFEYLRVLKDIGPRVFIAENVSGIAKGAAKGYFNQIMQKASIVGYNTTCKILDAKWLGVPQSRPRAIFIGVRRDLWRDDMNGRTHPAPKLKQVPLLDAFEGLIFTEQDKKETDISKYAIFKEATKLLPGQQSDKYFSLIKAHKRLPSPCITATCGNIGAAGAIHWDNRRFTISEIKRIMSVPDDYILTGNYSKKAERLGRMVAPFMMKSIAEQVLQLGIIGNANT
jgi:DNA (cytosine-5)-methyltransferase 1